MKPVADSFDALASRTHMSMPAILSPTSKWGHHDSWPFSWIRLSLELRGAIMDVRANKRGRMFYVWHGAATLAGPLVAKTLQEIS